MNPNNIFDNSTYNYCFLKFEHLRQRNLHYLFIIIYIFGILINFGNFYIFICFRNVRKRIVSLLHNGYLLGNTVVLANFLISSIDAVIDQDMTCMHLKITFIVYDLGMSLSVTFVVVFTVFQNNVLKTITKVVTLYNQKKRKWRALYLCVVLNAFTLFILMVILITEKRRSITLLLLYFVILNAIAIYYSYKSHKIPTHLNSDTKNNNLVQNQRWIDAKKDSKMINKAVILTAIASGINISAYFLMAFPLSIDGREYIIWTGRIYVIPLIFESVLYLKLTLQYRAENVRISVLHKPSTNEKTGSLNEEIGSQSDDRDSEMKTV